MLRGANSCNGGCSSFSSSSSSSNTGKRSYFGEELIDDAQLAKELNELSMKERELVYDEVHGVVQKHEETPEFVQTCLKELDFQLTKIPQNKRKWLDRAFFLKRGLEKDRDFKLMFLRADRYNAANAAARMAAFFTSKVELFGEEKIVQRITLDDLNPDTVKRSGCWRHISDVKDRAGRRTICTLPRFTIDGWKDNVRFSWYQIISILQEDEETQKNGFVYILAASDVKASPKNFIEFACMGASLLHTLPARYAAFHLCHNHPGFKAAMAVTQYVIGKDLRLRLRTHYGSALEIQYALMTFGIAKAAMPFAEDGSFCMAVHERYIEERRQKEQTLAEQDSALEKSGVILYPKPQDVLVGRGRPFQEHSGNIRYLEVVDSKLQQYSETTDRNVKSSIFRDVIRYIHDNGGRFLQCKDGKWVEAPDSAAREKVSHSFRHRTPEAVAAAATSSASGARLATNTKRKRN